MSTNPIVITPSTSVVLVNTADYSGNPVVLLPNLAGPGALGRIITIRDNDGGSVDPAKSIYLSTTGGALFQPELSTVTLSTIRITQPYGFITLTPRLNDGLGNTNYGLMNVYAFPEASPAAYINTFNANFSYLSTLSTANLAVSQDTIIQGNLAVGGSISYVNPGATVLDIGRVNTNVLSTATVLGSNLYGVNLGVSTINTSSFVVRDSGAILMPNAASWSNTASFAGAVDPNSLTLGNPAGGAGAQIGLSSNFFGLRAFTSNNDGLKLSTTMVMRDGTVGVNLNTIDNIGSSETSNYSLYVRGATQMSNLGINNNIVHLKTAAINGSNVEVNQFRSGLSNTSNFRIDTSSNITEGFFGTVFADQYKWLSVTKGGSVQFWTAPSGNTSARMTIDSAGRVGIGTTNPSYSLDINGSFSASTINYAKIYDSNLYVGTDVSLNTIRFRGTQGDGAGSEGYNHTVIGERIFSGSENSELLLFKGNDPFVSGNIDRIRLFAPYHQFDVTWNTGMNWNINSDPPAPQIQRALIVQPLSATSGAIGVNMGTSGPAYNLDVSGTSRITGNVGIGKTPGSVALDVSGLITAGFGTVGAPSYSFGSDSNMGIYRPAADTLGFVTNGTERMQINSSGNVGIGTTNPGFPLDVSGDSVRVSNSSGSAAINFDASGGDAARLSIIRQPNVWGNVDILNRGTGVIAFTTDYLGNSSSKFIMDASGRFGINGGGGFPSYNLDVSGTGHFTGNLTVDGTITGALSVVPTGCIMMWYTNTAPTGWLLCDGSAILGTYTALISLIGANTPNMKGRVPVGRDTIDASFNTIGNTGGAKTHTLTELEIPPHTHGYKFPSSQIAQGGGADVVAEDNFALALPKTSDSTGGGQAHNNLQPYLVLNYIIKT